MEKIYLTNVDGIAKLSGIDENNCTWVEFEVDFFAEQEPGICAICEKEITSGWLCTDSGEEVCSEHITTEKEEIVETFSLKNTPTIVVTIKNGVVGEVYYEGNSPVRVILRDYDMDEINSVTLEPTQHDPMMPEDLREEMINFQVEIPF